MRLAGEIVCATGGLAGLELGGGFRAGKRRENRLLLWHYPDNNLVRSAGMEKTFSEREGHVKRVLQVESMDHPLRVTIWNLLDEFYWSQIKYFPGVPGYSLVLNEDFQMLCRRIYRDLLRWPLDQLDDDWSDVRGVFRDRLLTSWEWYQVYDFIEFITLHWHDELKNDRFRAICNVMLEREGAGYRFVGKRIRSITDPVEIEEIEEALRCSLGPVAIHLDHALERLSARPKPDFRNSVKESISAVEALAGELAGKPKAKFSEAMAILERKGTMHGALRDAFESLYGYTSDASGIRHRLIEGDRVPTFNEAKFMLVACAAFVNYAMGEASSPPTK